MEAAILLSILAAYGAIAVGQDWISSRRWADWDSRRDKREPGQALPAPTVSDYLLYPISASNNEIGYRSCRPAEEDFPAWFVAVIWPLKAAVNVALLAGYALPKLTARRLKARRRSKTLALPAKAKPVDLQSAHYHAESRRQELGDRLYRVAARIDELKMASRLPPTELEIDQPLFRQVAPEQAFNWLGRPEKSARTLAQLIKFIDAGTEEEYRYHASENRNDFAEWARSAYGSESLAHLFLTATSRNQLLSMLGDSVGHNLKFDWERAFHWQRQDGSVELIGSLSDMAVKLECAMSCPTVGFEQYVNKDRNDLANWVEQAWGDRDLADCLRTTTCKWKTAVILNYRLKQKRYGTCARPTDDQEVDRLYQRQRDLKQKIADLTHDIKLLKEWIDVRAEATLLPEEQRPAQLSEDPTARLRRQLEVAEETDREVRLLAD